MDADPSRERNLGARPQILPTLIIATLVLALGGGLVWFGATVWHNFATFERRAKQSEAKTRLQALQRAQQSHRSQTGRYATKIDALKLDRPERPRFVVRLVSVGMAEFVAEAVSVRPEFDDRWTVSSEGVPVNRINGCRR